MTAAELRAEYDYRKAERLAILTDGGAVPVTESMLALAVHEASDWLQGCPHAIREQQPLL
jgi:hypothetical protein